MKLLSKAIDIPSNTIKNFKSSRSLPTGRKGRRIVEKDIPNILFDLLKKGTPHKHETRIQNIIIKDIRKSGFQPLKDKIGNIWCNTDEKSPVMFSCHMDTVHSQPRELDLYISTGTPQEEGFVFAKSSKHKTDTILGADDKVGVFILLQMIKNKVPGMYVFHVGEEAGCVGSKWLSNAYAKSIKKRFKYCIAMDRKNYGDVISHQRGVRCASIDFVGELANELNNKMQTKGKFIWAGAHGSYTDSAEYMKLIPECTNLSVGYFDQHTPLEKFDIEWLETYFIPTILKVDWEKLPVKRNPEEKESTQHDYNGFGYNTNTSYFAPKTPIHYKSQKRWTPSQGHVWNTDTYARADISEYIRFNHNYVIITDLLRQANKNKNLLEVISNFEIIINNVNCTEEDSYMTNMLLDDIKEVLEDKDNNTKDEAYVNNNHPDDDITDIAPIDKSKFILKSTTSQIKNAVEEMVYEFKNDVTTIKISRIGTLVQKILDNNKLTDIDVFSKKGHKLSQIHLTNISKRTQLFINLQGQKLYLDTIK